MSRAPIQVLIVPFKVLSKDEYEFAIFKRSDEPYWQVIAGGVEDDETPIEAAKREAYEEAHILGTAQIYPLKTTASIPAYFFKPKNPWPKDLYIVPGYYFGADVTGMELKLSYEHTEWKWAKYEEAISLLKWENDKTAIWELNQRLFDGGVISSNK